jgi:hypothetical protein
MLMIIKPFTCTAVLPVPFPMQRFNASSSSSSASSNATPARKRQRPEETSGSDYDPSEAGDGPCLKGRSELLLTHMSMYPGEEANSESIASANGKSKARIKELLSSNSLCKCKRKCRQAVNFAMVFKVCLTFWSLSKAAQDCVLWGIQNMKSGMENIERDDSSESGSSAQNSGSSDTESESEPNSKLLNTWFIQGRGL